MHDWFTATGQGYGSEYRWVATPTSNGNLRAYRLEPEGRDGERLPAARAEERSRERRHHAGSAVQPQGPRPHRLLVEPAGQPVLQPRHLQRHAEPEHGHRQRLRLLAVRERVAHRHAQPVVLQPDGLGQSAARCPASRPRSRTGGWAACRCSSPCSPKPRARSTSRRTATRRSTAACRRSTSRPRCARRSARCRS